MWCQQPAQLNRPAWSWPKPPATRFPAGECAASPARDTASPARPARRSAFHICCKMPGPLAPLHRIRRRTCLPPGGRRFADRKLVDRFLNDRELATELTNSRQRIRKNRGRVPGNFGVKTIFRLQNEKATRQKAAFSSRENSSNGGLESRQNFLPKSYEPKKGGVKRFLGNKCLYFQQLAKLMNIWGKCSKLRQKRLKNALSRTF